MTWPSSSSASSASSTPLQELNQGAELGSRAALLVQVIGYPDGRDGRRTGPDTCLSRRIEFDYSSYTSRTSGGPFLANVHPASGLCDMAGVIGGYEQGRDAPWSPIRPGSPAVMTLYDEAVTKNGQQPQDAGPGVGADLAEPGERVLRQDRCRPRRSP